MTGTRRAGDASWEGVPLAKKVRFATGNGGHFDAGVVVQSDKRWTERWRFDHEPSGLGLDLDSVLAADDGSTIVCVRSAYQHGSHQVRSFSPFEHAIAESIWTDRVDSYGDDWVLDRGPCQCDILR